jgi:hypothetical protein
MIERDADENVAHVGFGIVIGVHTGRAHAGAVDGATAANAAKLK